MKDYYKETIDWSMVKEGDPVEIDGNRLAYFLKYDSNLVFYHSIKGQKFISSTQDNLCRPLNKSCIKREVDWSKVPVDTKVVVDNCGEKLKRYFSHFKNNTVYTFDKGQTSWSCAGYMRVDWRIDQVEIVEDDNVTKK